MSSETSSDRADDPVVPDTPAPLAATATEPPASEPVVVDVLDHHGRTSTRQRIMIGKSKRTFTVGRSVNADVLVDDPHVAPVHVEIAVQPDGSITATDHGSVNGIFVDGERHRDAHELPIPSGRLHIGRTHLAIRTAHQPLPAEKPDHGFDHQESGRAHFFAIGGAIACAAITVYFAWVGAPRDITTQIVVSLAGGAFAFAIWIAFWTLLSRIIRGEPRLVMHSAPARRCG